VGNAVILPKRMKLMLQVYGAGPANEVCGNCDHFIQHKQSKSWFKCDLTAPGGPATDWRATWPACGRYVSTDLCAHGIEGGIDCRACLEDDFLLRDARARARDEHMRGGDTDG
jgi:hypothetical protein